MKETCKYGIPGMPCGQPATTKRLRPSATAEWDVCQEHAEELDRIGRHVEENRIILDRLADH